MLKLRIIHHLRTAIFLLVLTVILGSVGTLIWANSTGMPKSWRQAVERAIAQHGIHVEIGGLSYHPLEGVIARQVKVFANSERKEVISRLEGLILDLDNAKLAKGEVQLSKVKLSKARLVLPVNPDDPNSEVLEITNIEGEFIPPGNRHIEIRNARGTIEGIDIVLNAKITDDLIQDVDPAKPSNQDGHRDLMARIVRELRQWSFDPDSPPQVRIQCVGKRSKLDQARAKIKFQAKAVEKNQHSIERIEAEAELQGSMLSVQSLEAINGKSRLNARFDYGLDRKSGRFNVDSTLEIPKLLQSWLGLKALNELTIAGKQQLRASGEFQIKSGESPRIQATGHARCESAMLRGIRFDQIESAFAWNNEDLFFKDLIMAREDGKVSGKVLIQGDLVRMDLDSSLLPELYRPLFLGTPTEDIIDNFTIREDSEMNLKLEGGFNRTDLKSWAYTGTAALRNVSYRGVGLTSMETSLSVSSAQMDFTDGTIIFDYADYPMAKRFEGPENGTLTYQSVRYARGDNNTLSFDGLEGNFWPAPVCRLFLNKTADHLEQYKFHRPPSISGKGLIDLKEKKQTRLELAFNSKHQAEYDFLDAPVSITQPSGTVIITDTGTTLRDLEMNAFMGSIRANMDFPRGKAMSANLALSNISMDSINSTYGLNMECGGELTGKVDFAMLPGNVSTMSGKGSLNLQKTELFSVPLFGPLSKVMQVVFNDKRAGAERAKEANCTFVINEGIVASDDFKTTTTSLVFAGDGWVDLDKKTMDITMRTNTRGFFGFLTIPLKPFYGLFQFRGTGPLKDPTWEKVAFTKPNDKVQEMLLKASKRD